MTSTALRSFRALSMSKGKTAGRNSQGRITIFHRGGGSKRLHRVIDLKRNTSSMGIVERIEYDPNRSSRIALVRWIEGMQPHRPRKCKTVEESGPPHKVLESSTTTIRGLYSFSTLFRKVGRKQDACTSPEPMAPYVVVGLPNGMPSSSKNSKV